MKVTEQTITVIDTKAAGGRLRGLRATKGLTQEELAVASGVAVVTVHRAEGGRFSIVSLIKLNAALGSSLDYILYGTGAP